MRPNTSAVRFGLELILAFIALVAFPARSYLFFSFIAPIATLVRDHKIDMALWLTLGASLLQEMFFCGQQLQDTSLPVVMLLSIYITYFMLKRMPLEGIPLGIMTAFFVSIGYAIYFMRTHPGLNSGWAGAGFRTFLFSFSIYVAISFVASASIAVVRLVTNRTSRN